MCALGLSMWGHMNAFVYDHPSKVSGLASFRTGLWVLFCWRAEFYSIEQILWYRTESGEPYLILLAPLALYKRGPSLCTHYLLKAWVRPQLVILAEYEVCVNMCKRSNYVWLCKSTNRNWWSPRQGSMWYPPELIYNGLVHMRLKWRRSSIESKRLMSLKDLLCWNLKSIDVYNTLRL